MRGSLGGAGVQPATPVQTGAGTDSDRLIEPRNAPKGPIKPFRATKTAYPAAIEPFGKFQASSFTNSKTKPPPGNDAALRRKTNFFTPSDALRELQSGDKKQMKPRRHREIRDSIILGRSGTGVKLSKPLDNNCLRGFECSSTLTTLCPAKSVSLSSERPTTSKEETTPDFHVNPKTPVSRFRNIFNPSEFNIVTEIPIPKTPKKLDTHL